MKNPMYESNMLSLELTTCKKTDPSLFKVEESVNSVLGHKQACIKKGLTVHIHTIAFERC